MNKIKLVVGGIEYKFTTEDDEVYMQGLGDSLNRQLDKITKESPFLSATMVAVLAALENLDLAKKEALSKQALLSEVKNLTEQAACVRLDAEEAKREVERLARENRKLKKDAAAKRSGGIN